MQEKDVTLWDYPGVALEEVKNRLGWLDSISDMKKEIPNLIAFRDMVKESFEKIILLGMGGSSLAPEVFMNIFGKKTNFPSLVVIDTTNPIAIESHLNNTNLEKTLFIVSSKSGGTIETLSLYKFFFDKVSEITTTPGKHFVAITDNDSKLEKLAIEKKFLRIFIAPSNVGGRYSIFTFFGMVPATLIGAPLEEILDIAAKMQDSCGEETAISPVSLGVSLGEYALLGKNKLTFIFSDSLVSFGDWVEQLIAESTGKQGKGIVPIVGEKILSDYPEDRVFVYIYLKGDQIPKIDAPSFHIELANKTAIAGEFFRWEVATVIASSILEIDPFDQPDVELAKIKARELMDEYTKEKKLTSDAPQIITDDYEVYCANIEEEMNFYGLLSSLYSNLEKGNYISIMAYLPATQKIKKVLEEIRSHLQKEHKKATTLGFGPRFLHSTGQLHKGDNNDGVFLQITHSCNTIVNIPGENYDFNTLILAQAMGDYKALQEKNRRILRYHINNDALLIELENLRDTLQNDEQMEY